MFLVYIGSLDTDAFLLGSLTYDVVAATDAPTVAPTTYWDNKKKRKEDTRLLIVIIVCAVAGCCCLAALSMACFAKHKKSPEPPLKAPPISLGGVDVDVSQEEVCSPRRVNLVYAPLATWYNAPERAALRAKHGPLPLSPDAFRKWPAMNLVTMAFLDDQGVPPAF